MASQICRLVGSPSYGGTLRTAPSVSRWTWGGTGVSMESLVLVDTSNLADIPRRGSREPAEQ
jgi:hypothetical protein